MPRPNAKDRRTQAKIAAAMSDIGFALPGTLIKRHICCKNPNCRCTADPPQLHGPYYQWTRKINGKTKTTRLNADQAERYQAWFDNAKKIRTLATELETLSLEIANSTERWT